VVALRVQAGESACVLAAIGLLVGHGFWLHDEAFVFGFVRLWFSDGDGTLRASLDWRAAAAVSQESWRLLRASDSDGQVLRIAASLADGVPVDLRDAVSGLDETSIGLVAVAVLAGSGCGRAGASGRVER